MRSDESYNSDGQGRKELARLKTQFLASMPKELKKKTKHFRDSTTCGNSAMYVIDLPWELKDRMTIRPNTHPAYDKGNDIATIETAQFWFPDKARVIGRNHAIYLWLETETSEKGYRLYSIKCHSECTLIAYRCRMKGEYRYFQCFACRKDIDEVIKQFWQQYHGQLQLLQSNFVS